MARSMSARGNPMLSMFAIAASLSGPMVKDEGLLNWPPWAWAWGAAGAGEGVAGTLGVVDDDCAGADGVEAWAGSRAGVEGAALLADAAGWGFGWSKVSIRARKRRVPG